MMKVTAGFAVAALAVGPALGLVAVAAVATPVEVCVASAPRDSEGGGGGSGPVAPRPPETASVVFPLPAGTWVRTDGFGFRDFAGNPFHTGTDYAAPDGTPILAAADGIVTVAEFSQDWGGLIVIEHTIQGQVATAYVHMWQHGIHVTPGQQVTAGQHIGDVGSSGMSTGPHLHFEVRPGGSFEAAIDAEPWLAASGAIDLGTPGGEPPAPYGCDPADADDAAEASAVRGFAPGREGVLL